MKTIGSASTSSATAQKQSPHSLPLLATVLLAALSLGLTACNDQGGGGMTVDTSRVETSFSTPDTDASAKSEMKQMVASVKNGDWAGAGAAVKALASNAKLTPEQQSSIKDLGRQIEDKVKEAMSKAGEKAGEAMQGAKDATGKALEDAGRKLQQK